MKKPEEILVDMELEALTKKLSETQTQINNLLKATDSLVESKLKDSGSVLENEPLAFQFFIRVHSSKMIEAFSEMAKMSLSHVDYLKRALDENKRQKDLIKSMSVPPVGENAQEG